MNRHKFIQIASIPLLGLSLLLFSSLSLAKTKAPAEKSHPILVMAASSLTNVLPEVAKAWKTQGGKEVTFNFEATSRLAKQVTSGAPADLFFSADTEWMDYLEKNKKLDPSTRTALLSNRIVLAIPAHSEFNPTASADLVDERLKHLALAGESVPAGKFARAALKSEGVLEKLQDRIVNAENVRAALLWIAKKEAEAGVVFETDVRVEPRVKIAFVFPESSHPKIEYPAAVIQGSKHAFDAKRFLEFCKGKQAKKIFEEAGFKVLAK